MWSLRRSEVPQFSKARAQKIEKNGVCGLTAKDGSIHK